jgi:hypothetical protein
MPLPFERLAGSHGAEVTLEAATFTYVTPRAQGLLISPEARQPSNHKLLVTISFIGLGIGVVLSMLLFLLALIQLIMV